SAGSKVTDQFTCAVRGDVNCAVAQPWWFVIFTGRLPEPRAVALLILKFLPRGNTKRSSYGSFFTTELLPVKEFAVSLRLSALRSTQPCVMWRLVEINCTWSVAGKSVSTRQLVGDRFKVMPFSQAPRYSLFQKS